VFGCIVWTNGRALGPPFAGFWFAHLPRCASQWGKYPEMDSELVRDEEHGMGARGTARLRELRRTARTRKAAHRTCARRMAGAMEMTRGGSRREHEWDGVTRKRNSTGATEKARAQDGEAWVRVRRRRR